MKNLFPGYYRPSKDDFAQLWDDCIFAFDANVLLDLYRYKTATRNELLTIMEGIAPRLWLPYQAAYEYQKNRLSVIKDQAKAYADVRKILQDSLNKVRDDLNRFKKHPAFDSSDAISRLSSLYQALEQELGQHEQEHDEKFPPLSLEGDEIRERLDDLFDGKVGASYDSGKLVEVCREGEARYKKGIPPGFADKDKPGEGKYGDLIVWLQMLEHAKQEEKAVIFITNDNKEDWWLKLDGKTLSARPELIEEMYQKTGQKGYIYSAAQFMEYAGGYLKQNVAIDAIEEVRTLQLGFDPAPINMISVLDDAQLRSLLLRILPVMKLRTGTFGSNPPYNSRMIAQAVTPLLMSAQGEDSIKMDDILRIEQIVDGVLREKGFHDGS